jgi:sugar-specific transcriptional regulator TrmB
MNKLKVIKELRDREHLTEKEYLILQELSKNKLTAKELSKITKIPLGRIYDPLNELLEQKLIDKEGKKPCYYSFDDPHHKVIPFLKKKFNKFLEDENTIIELLEEPDSPKIELLKSKEDFTFYLIKALSSCKKGLKTVARHGSLPFIFYPSDKKSFVKLRDLINKKRTTIAHTTDTKATMVYNAYQEAIKEEKYFYAICNEETFLWHIELIKKNLGEEFLKRMIDDFKNRVKKREINMYIIKEYLPMQIFIIHNKVILFHIHLGVGSGIEIQNKETVDLYRGMFSDMIKRSKPVSSYFKNI